MPRYYYYDGTDFYGRGDPERTRVSLPEDWTFLPQNWKGNLPIGEPGNGRRYSRLQDADELHGVYLAIEDNTEVPPGYFDRRVDLVLTGPELTVGTQVQETVTTVERSLSDTKRQKESELTSYAREVFFSAFEHDPGGLELWATSDDISLFSRLTYVASMVQDMVNREDDAMAAYIADIDSGGSVNSAVAAYFASKELAWRASAIYFRDVRVFLYDRATLQQVRDNANANQWEELMMSQGTFAWQVRNATNRVQDDIDAAYDAGNGTQADIRAIDVADVSYNWPPHFSGPLRGNGVSRALRLR